MKMFGPIAESLKFNPTVFLIQLVLFLALLVVMNALVWKPVLAHLKARDERIADAYRQRDQLQHEMEQLRADYLTRIGQVEAEARGHIQKAIKEAQSERERILAEARAQSETMLQQGVADMERETAEALRSLRGEIVGLALGAADKELGSAADNSLLRRSIESRIPTDPARN